MYQKEKWSNPTIWAVWQIGREIPGYDPNIFRVDACGDAMQFSEHGNRDSKLGWEIDHIKPTVLGGSDDLYNLQPLYWKNNALKADSVQLKCSARV